MPLTTVSTSAAPISVQLTQYIQSPSSDGNGTSANEIATACTTVFSLPSQLAAITRLRSATKR